MFGNQNKTTAVVINKNGPNGLGVVQGLGRKGIPVISVDFDPKNITFFSKYATKRICPNPERSEVEFINYLINLGKQFTTKPVLFPTADEILLIILKHKTELEKYYRCPIAEPDVVLKLINKKVFYQMLDELNAPYSETYFPESIAEVESISANLDYPYLIKPVYSYSFKKKFRTNCFKADSSEELLELYKKAIVMDEATILQKVISGGERYLVYTYFNRNSKPVAICCYKKIRIFPIDFGNACVCQSEWNQEAVELSTRVLENIGYYGIAEAELQRDPLDGKLKLIEINARTTTETRLSAKCGMHMEYIAYCDVLGSSIKKNEFQRKGIKWINIIDDFLATFSSSGYIRNGKITFREWLNSLKGEREYAMFAWDDPVPFILLVYQFLGSYAFKFKTYRTILSLRR